MLFYMYIASFVKTSHCQRVKRKIFVQAHLNHKSLSSTHQAEQIIDGNDQW